MMALLQNAPLWILPYLLVITVIITIHELGHFLTARAFGVAIDRFALGFGPALASWRDKAGIEWRIGWLPFGGYVRFAGDENAASIPDGDDLATMRAHIVAREGPGAEMKYLHFKPLWQRALIVAAGPFANFALAVVLFSIFFGAFGEPVTSRVISDVVAGQPAAQAGFQRGDVLLTADGRPLESFEDLQFYVQYRSGVPITFTVRRGTQTVAITATPASSSQASPFGGAVQVGHLGIAATGQVLKRYNPLEAVGRGATKTWQVTATTVYYLGRIVTGHVNPNQLHSVVGMWHASGALTTQAVATAREEHVNIGVAAAFVIIQMAGFISVSVGLLNLLPVPVLDGGHLLFYAYESVARRPLNAGIQAAGYRVGLALLVGLMLFATWNDLHQLRVFHFLGGLIS